MAAGSDLKASPAGECRLCETGRRAVADAKGVASPSSHSLVETYFRRVSLPAATTTGAATKIASTTRAAPTGAPAALLAGTSFVYRQRSPLQFFAVKAADC